MERTKKATATKQEKFFPAIGKTARCSACSHLEGWHDHREMDREKQRCMGEGCECASFASKAATAEPRPWKSGKALCACGHNGAAHYHVLPFDCVSCECRAFLDKDEAAVTPSATAAEDAATSAAADEAIRIYYGSRPGDELLGKFFREMKAEPDADVRDGLLTKLAEVSIEEWKLSVSNDGIRRRLKELEKGIESERLKAVKAIQDMDRRLVSCGVVWNVAEPDVVRDVILEPDRAGEVLAERAATEGEQKTIARVRQASLFDANAPSEGAVIEAQGRLEKRGVSPLTGTEEAALASEAAALARGVCDGEHAHPLCSDPGCWRTEIPEDVTAETVDAKIGEDLADDEEPSVEPRLCDDCSHDEGEHGEGGCGISSCGCVGYY